jgi:hypothetical protein
VQLNGKELGLGPADALPAFNGAATATGDVTLAPTTITFVTIPTAGNGATEPREFSLDTYSHVLPGLRSATAQ